MNIAYQLTDPNDPGYDTDKWTADIGQTNIEDWLAGMFEVPEGLRVVETAKNIVRESREGR